MNYLEPTSVRTLLSWSLLFLLLLASTLPAQLAPGFDAESAEGGGKYPLNGIHPRSASQILRVETDPGDGSPLVQRLFKVVAEQDCEYITVARNESSWSATQAVPTDFVKIYSDSRIVVYINPECACDPHGQELELLSLTPASAGDVRLRRVVQPEKPVYTQELYNGENLLNLSPGTTSPMNLAQLPDSTEFSIQAEVCDPDCAAPDSALVIQSFDPRAIVFLHGDNVEEKAVAKGLDPINAASRPIGGAALAPYIDVDGNIDFGEDAEYKLIVAYEHDAADWNDAGWAFDDHIEEMRACGGVADEKPQVVVLRDSIGEDSSTTDGNNRYPITQNGGPSGWGNAVAPVASTQNVSLTSWRTVLSPATSIYNPSAYDYFLRVWDSEGDMQADPTCIGSNCTSHFFDNPTSSSPFGTVFVFPFGNLTTYEYIFDLTGLGIDIAAGQTKYIGLAVETPGAQLGALRVMESSELGIQTDWSGNYNQGWDYTSNDVDNVHEGRLAVTVDAVVQ